MRAGRKVGSRLNGHDVLSQYCRQQRGVVVERLDYFNEHENQRREAVVQDTRTAPVPDIVAFRCDFADWLRRLSIRNRRIATSLAIGNQTQGVSRRFGVSEGRIAQLRRELAESWVAFRGEEGVCAKIDPVAV